VEAASHELSFYSESNACKYVSVSRSLARAVIVTVAIVQCVLAQACASILANFLRRVGAELFAEMVKKGWSRRFDEPIALPDGTELTTLREAVAYLARTVRKAEQAMPEVLAAAEILTHATERE
jgi:hypothetical protein